MNSDISIVLLHPSEWQRYKQLRLEALTSDPHAFGTSYQDDVKKPDQFWIERLEAAQTGDTFLVLFAESKGELVGMVGAYFGFGKEEVVEVATIWGMYVRNTLRGRGVGKRLLTELIIRLESVARLQKAELTVSTEQTEAFNLYKSIGFTVVSQGAIVLGDGKEHQEYIMERKLM